MILPDWIYKVERLVTSDKTGEWCKLPYPGHPKGCPNYGKKSGCPPNAGHVSDYFDLGRPLYLVHSWFSVDLHAVGMKTDHPGWTWRQCRCVLYWQSTSRKELAGRAQEAMKWLGTTAMTTNPEAMGVNVFATAAVSGLKLEKIRSLSVCRHVALLGFSKR